MFENVLKEIQAHDTIIIHRHHHPDGDALGSQIGLKHLILANYPGKKVYIVGDEAGRYAFMEDSVMDTVEDEEYDEALAFILDTSSTALISDERYPKAHRTVRIDHHLFLGKIAETEVVDSSFESCCGLIAAMAMECGWKLTPSAATALYTGMVTDSGRFRYDATNARTFRLASFLMEQPIDVEGLYRHLYATDLEQVKLRAQFMQSIQMTPNRVAYIYTTRKQLEEMGCDAFTISRGMVSVMADIRSVDIWVSFTEADAGILCELRSSSANINPVAVKYGGGGHKKASGATVRNREEAIHMLKDLDEMAGIQQ